MGSGSGTGLLHVVRVHSGCMVMHLHPRAAAARLSTTQFSFSGHLRGGAGPSGYFTPTSPCASSALKNARFNYLYQLFGQRSVKMMNALSQRRVQPSENCSVLWLFTCRSRDLQVTSNGCMFFWQGHEGQCVQTSITSMQHVKH